MNNNFSNQAANDGASFLSAASLGSLQGVKLEVGVNDLQAVVFKIMDMYEERKAEEDNNTLLSADEACKFLHVTRPTLWKYEVQNYLKPTKRVGKRVFYKKSELVDFLNK